MVVCRFVVFGRWMNGFWREDGCELITALLHRTCTHADCARLPPREPAGAHARSSKRFIVIVFVCPSATVSTNKKNARGKKANLNCKSINITLRYPTHGATCLRKTHQKRFGLTRFAQEVARGRFLQCPPFRERYTAAAV